MPERVVDLLEIIDIHVEQAKRLAGPAGTGDAALQEMLKLHAIGDLGQRIDARQIANSLLCSAALRDVLRRIDPVRRIAVAVLDNRAGVRHRNRLAVLALERGFLRQARWRQVG